MSGTIDARESARVAVNDRWPWALNMRQRMKEDGVLKDEDGFLVFTRDAEFTSPSSAAAVIHGGHANGLTAWKDKNGKTLKQIESFDNSLQT